MTVTSTLGVWSLNFSWGCDGSFTRVNLTFNGDGTFTSSAGKKGRWYEQEGVIIWKYTNGTTYGGTVSGPSYQGIMSTLDAGNPGSGCWHGGRTDEIEITTKRTQDKYDETGEAVK